MFLMFRFFLLFFLCLNVYSADVETKPEAEKKVHEKIEANKDSVSLNTYRGNFISLGAVLPIGPIMLFGCFSGSIFSESTVAKDEYQYSIVRSLHCEGGLYWEMIPFFGLMVSMLSKEFLNKKAINHSSIIGVKIALFMHVACLIGEVGVMMKKYSKNIFTFHGFGVSVFFGLKVKKDNVFTGVTGNIG